MAAQVPEPSPRSSIALQQKLAVADEEVARLRRDLAEARQREAEALEQQTATAEILRVIAASPTELSRVFDTVGERAYRMFGAAAATIWQVDGDVLRCTAHIPKTVLMPSQFGSTLPLSPRSMTGRTVLEGRVVHIADVRADDVGSEFPESVHSMSIIPTRTRLHVPLVRDGVAIGAISIGRLQVQPFSESEIALLRTFADQAVIAIENARLFQELQDKSRQLEEVSRHKSEFLANMSHELRTPLNAIIGFSEVLLERIFGELNERQADYLNDILGSGQHQLSLINDILDLSKVEAGQMELEPGEFSLQEALENGLTMLKERAGRHGIGLSLQVDPGVGLIEADERKVKQVVFNLLSNAVKFTPDGGQVVVTAKQVDQAIQVAVSDTGIGIAPEDQEHVFDEFRQVGQGSAKREGTGLGLALAKKFVELYGGRLWVESEVGTGSTFTFTLPPPAVVHHTQALP